MRRLISILTVVVMVLAMMVPAFADDDTSWADDFADASYDLYGLKGETAIGNVDSSTYQAKSGTIAEDGYIYFGTTFWVSGLEGEVVDVSFEVRPMGDTDISVLSAEHNNHYSGDWLDMAPGFSFTERVTLANNVRNQYRIKVEGSGSFVLDGMVKDVDSSNKLLLNAGYLTVEDGTWTVSYEVPTTTAAPTTTSETTTAETTTDETTTEVASESQSEQPSDITESQSQTEQPSDITESQSQTEQPSDVTESQSQTEQPSDITESQSQTEQPSDITESQSQTEQPSDVTESQSQTEQPSNVTESQTEQSSDITTVPASGEIETTIQPVTESVTASDKTTAASGKIQKPAKVKIKKIFKKKKSAKKLKVVLKKAKRAKGYQVAVFASKKKAKKAKKALVKKFFKKAKYLKKPKFTIKSKKLLKRKTLYVRARAFNYIGTKKNYGKWSKMKKVKVK